MNFTYILILVVIIIAIIHLYKINNNETFKILSEEQNVGSHNVFINSMEQIIFSTINKNLKTLFDEKANKDSMPDLSVIAYSGVTAPNGWQLCDGATLEYKDGNPNSSSRFVLDNTGNPIKTPDLRGRFILGSGSGINLTPRIINKIGGKQDATLLEHSHTATVNDPGHVHSYFMLANSSPGDNWAAARGSNSPFGNYGGVNNSKTDISVTISSTGTTDVDLNMPPFYVLTYIIKKPSQSL